MNEQPVITLENVSFSAQDKTIIRSLSYEIPPGIATAFVGPSGGGKSTVLKLAAGLIVPSEGFVRFRGQEIATMNRAKTLAFRKQAAFVFQDSALWANQSLRQILELPLKIHFPKMNAEERTQRIVAVLAETGYRKDIDIRPAALSMGEQKLIAFARALVCQPTILFLDEWTESLDDKAARRLVDIVRRKREAGCTIAFVSHNIPVIRELAEKICIIEDGSVSRCVTAAEFALDKTLAKTIEEGITQ